MQATEAKKASISVDPSALQSLLDQFESLKTQLVSLQQQASAPPAHAPVPAPAPRNYGIEFVHALEQDPPNWKQALAILPEIEWSMIENWLATIFCKNVTVSFDIGADRRALWQALLRTDLVTAQQLSETWHQPTSSRTALLNLVLQDAEDGEMSAWVTLKTPPALLHASFVKCRLSCRNLVAFSAYSANLRSLRNLFRFKTSDGQFVFPRDATSSWTWSNFWPELKSEATNDSNSGFVQCLQFWCETVAKEIQV